MVATDSLFAIASACLYAGSGLCILSRLWKRGGKVPGTYVAVAAAAAALHAVFLYQVIFAGPGIQFGFGPAVSSALLFSAAFLIAASCSDSAKLVAGVLLPAAALGVLMPLAFPGSAMHEQVWTPLFRLHVGIALAVYGLLVIALLQAVLLELLDQRFRSGVDPIPETGLLSNMPPILVAERSFFNTMGLCFVVLTALLIVGVLVTLESRGVLFVLGHKTYLTWISWILLAALLCGRRFLGWRGRKALNWFWCLCAAYAIAYLGYAFIVENLLR